MNMITNNHTESFEANMIDAISTKTALIHRAGKEFRNGRINKDEYINVLRMNVRTIAQISTMIES